MSFWAVYAQRRACPVAQILRELVPGVGWLGSLGLSACPAPPLAHTWRGVSRTVLTAQRPVLLRCDRLSRWEPWAEAAHVVQAASMSAFRFPPRGQKLSCFQGVWARGMLTPLLCRACPALSRKRGITGARMPGSRSGGPWLSLLPHRVRGALLLEPPACWRGSRLPSPAPCPLGGSCC